MKFNKKAILATAGVLAGVLAPASTVFAAGGYTATGTSAASGLSLPVYTDSSANTSAGSANAYSVATVIVKTGFLQLDRVPNLHFINSFAGGTASLMDNTKGGYTTGNSYVDGNNEGRLEVADSRKDTGSPAKPFGWKLTAQLGVFQTIDKQGTATPAPAATDKDWALTLINKDAAQNIIAAGSTNFAPMAGNGPADVPFGADINSPSSILHSITSAVGGGGGAPTAGPEVTIWHAAAGTGAGVTSGLFNKSTSANLAIPTAVDNGSYYAPIKWTLVGSDV